jgi:alpha-glucosidase
MGRDGGRTPMPWRADANQAGFTQAATSWLPIPKCHVALAVDRQEENDQSTLACYRRLLAWRKQHPALRFGELELIALPEPVVAWRRRYHQECITAFFNISDQPVRVQPNDLIGFQPACELGFITAPANGALQLPPYGVSLGTENRDGQTLERG